MKILFRNTGHVATKIIVKEKLSKDAAILSNQVKINLIHLKPQMLRHWSNHHWAVLAFLKFSHFVPEHKETGSSGATENEV